MRVIVLRCSVREWCMQVSYLWHATNMLIGCYLFVRDNRFSAQLDLAQYIFSPSFWSRSRSDRSAAWFYILYRCISGTQV
jgi:hypothetical protein